MTSEKLIKLFEARNYEDLVEKINSKSLDTWVELLVNELQSTKSDETLKLIKSIFRGFEKNRNNLSSVIHTTYKESINKLTKEDIKFTNNLVCILNHEVNHLSSKHIADICSKMLDKICRKKIGDGNWLKFFPKVIEVVSRHPVIEHDKSEERLSGIQYKTHIIQEICSSNWQPENLTQLTELFKEISLTPNEADIVIEKLLDQLREVNSETLPHFVHQIIDLSTDCNKIEQVLKSILKHFNELDIQVKRNEQNESDEFSEIDSEPMLSSFQLSSVKGTILLFISDTARRNESLGRSLIKIIKNAKESLSKEVVTSFFISLSLSFAQGSRFYDEAQNLLKSLIHKCIVDQHKVKDCKWLKQKSSELPDIKIILLDVVKMCGSGWEHVVSGLVDLGFNLMSSYGPKPGAFGRSFELEIANLNTPQQDTCDTGLHVLARIFKMRDLSRKQIITELLKRIPISINAPAYQYIDLLKAIVKSYPQALLQFNKQIQETVDYLNVMHPHNAKKFLKCLFPLVVISSTLRDSLILVLRKSLFTGQLNSRLSGLRGFLLFLYNFQVNQAVSLSQISSQSTQSIFSTAISQSVASNSPGRTPNHEFLCLEILQVLKRCLNQQYEICQELYIGLYNVVVKNPRLAPFILENLVKQLRKYYEEDTGIVPPVQISACISMKKETSILLEPLSILLQSIHYCLHSVVKLQSDFGLDEDEIIDVKTINSIHEIFKSIADRLIKSEIDDFQIDKDSDFLVSNKIGQKNCIIVVMVLNLYQSMIEYKMIHNELSSENASEILQLFQTQKRVFDIIANTKSPEIKGKLLNDKLLPSVSIFYLSTITSNIFSNTEADKEDSIETFNSCENFIKHVMSQTNLMLTHANIHGYFPGIGGGIKQVVYKHVTQIASSCLHHFMTERNDPARSPATLLALQSFHTALLYMKTWQKSKLSDFFVEVSGKDFEETQSEKDCATRIIKKLQRVVISYISGDSNPLSSTHKKILSELIGVLETLVSVGNEIYSETTAQQCHEWWKKVCVEFKIDDLTASKKLLQSHLHSSFHSSSHPEIIFRDLCIDLHAEFGSICEIEEDENNVNYKIISQDNCAHVLPILVTFLDGILGDTDWMLQKMKGHLLSGGSGRKEVALTDDKDDKMNKIRNKTEDSICSRICTLVVGLLELSQTSISSASSIDQIINCFILTFNFMTNFSKYHIWMYAHGIGNLSSRFEKLHNFVGDEFMKPVYGFIEHAEKAQTDRLDAAKAKQDNKKKGKGELPISSAMKVKLTKEMKEIPKLIYAIEKHEQNLILLGKKAKIDLMKCHHLPVSRDFRIDVGVLRKLDKTRENESLHSSDEENQPANKQPRLDIDAN